MVPRSASTTATTIAAPFPFLAALESLPWVPVQTPTTSWALRHLEGSDLPSRHFLAVNGHSHAGELFEAYARHLFFIVSAEPLLEESPSGFAPFVWAVCWPSGVDCLSCHKPFGLVRAVEVQGKVLPLPPAILGGKLATAVL